MEMIPSTSTPASPSPALSTAQNRGKLPALLRACRPHQWVKNVLLFVPVLAGHQFRDHPGKLADAAIGFAAFCLCASAGYLVNDLRDVVYDRQHPAKRHRPLASGEVSIGAATVLAAALTIGAFAVSYVRLPLPFLFALAVYLAGTLLYSAWLKTRLLVDVFLLAGLYTLRVLAGGAATSVPVTPWLLAFSSFFFLSLAFAKRYAELIEAGHDDAEFVKARNYRQEDMANIESVGPASGYLAVLVLAIYISTSPLAEQLYHHPTWLWLVCPVLLYWLTRIWFIARRGGLTEDPIFFALTDRISWVAGAVAAAIVVAATRDWW
jgi:4-hydroxybenzoate polyprenyltransferase